MPFNYSYDRNVRCRAYNTPEGRLYNHQTIDMNESEACNFTSLYANAFLNVAETLE